MKKRNVLFSIAIILLLFLTGCGTGNSAGTDEERPETINSTFIFFAADRSGGVEQPVGSLYMKKQDSEVEQIANNVFETAIYDNDTEQVLYTDEDSNLFLYNSEDAPEHIDQNVRSAFFSDTPDKKIVYGTEDGSVYVWNEASSERIGTDVQELEFLNDDVYYTDHNSNLLAYNLETREEKRIANGVSDFRLLNDGEVIVYTDDMGILYYLKPEEDTHTVVSSRRVYLDTVVQDGEELYYVEVNDDNGIATLYRTNVIENSRPEIVADDTTNFEFWNDSIIYLTGDAGLYQLQEDDVSKRLAMDVFDYTVLDNQIIYKNRDNTLYNWDGEENAETVVGHDVQSYEVFPNGRIFYLTEDEELFEGSTKIASNVNAYGAFYDTLVYANEDNLYLIAGNEEPLVLEEEIQNYSAGYYQNQLVYQNNLNIADIAGIWETTTDADDKEYFSINSNGNLKTLMAGDSVDLTEDYSHYNELMLADSYNRLKFSFAGETLQLELNGSTYELQRSTEEDAKTYLTEVEQEKELEEEKREQERVAEEEENEKTEAQSVVRLFITYLSEAINTGSFYYISSYIDESSDFYEEQSEFVLDLYSRNIKEDLYDYQIQDVTINSDGTATVETRETFNIYNGDTEEESTSTYDAVYTLKKIDDLYHITNLSVE